MVTLAIENSSGSEVTYELTRDTISIGASNTNDVVVRAPGVAPSHLVIQRNGDAYTFLGQKRQMAVLNGERRSRGVLHVGDRIRIGTATLVFRAGIEDETSVRMVESGHKDDDIETAAPAQTQPAADTQKTARARSEVVLYNEERRVAAARHRMVEALAVGVKVDLGPSLKSFFSKVFENRQSLLARVDSSGRISSLVSEWTGDVPRLPMRTYDELGHGDRFALLRLGDRRILIFPVAKGSLGVHAFLFVETNEDHQDDDEVILAELAKVLAVRWESLERSNLLLGPWEADARSVIDTMFPGTSQAVKLLRDSILQASRSQSPVLLCGRAGVGRMTVANLIASIHPAGQLNTKVIQVEENGDSALRTGLFGPGPEPENPAVHAEGGLLVLRDIHLASATVQREIAATVMADIDSGWGPKVRWVATTEEDAMTLLNDGRLDPALYNLFREHVIRIPSLKNRREDLPLLVVRLLDVVAGEQAKEIRGIELESLNSLLNHTFDGEMSELLSELRRLVSATASGDMIRGTVPGRVVASSAGGGDESVISASALLSLDDLKTVVPSVERLVIDRVLKRTQGNQSKAARTLNLSRGALISKMKDYEIPDYRYLRRR